MSKRKKKPGTLYYIFTGITKSELVLEGEMHLDIFSSRSCCGTDSIDVCGVKSCERFSHNKCVKTKSSAPALCLH